LTITRELITCYDSDLDLYLNKTFQVLTVAWELTKMHSKYKKCGWSSKNFDPSVPSGNATLKKSKKGSEGLSPEEQHLISDTNV